MQKRIIVLVTFSVLVFALMGCGGSASKNVTVNLREFSFSPDHFTVEAGQEVTLNLKNLGALNHNFHIMLVGSEIDEKWETEDESNAILNLDMLEGGSGTSVTFNAPDVPGTYQFVCSVPGHFQQGMIGTMTVIAP